MSGHVGRSAQGQIRTAVREALERLQAEIAHERQALPECELDAIGGQLVDEIATLLRDESGIDWPT